MCCLAPPCGCMGGYIVCLWQSCQLHMSLFAIDTLSRMLTKGNVSCKWITGSTSVSQTHFFYHIWSVCALPLFWGVWCLHIGSMQISPQRKCMNLHFRPCRRSRKVGSNNLAPKAFLNLGWEKPFYWFSLCQFLWKTLSNSVMVVLLFHMWLGSCIWDLELWLCKQLSTLLACSAVCSGLHALIGVGLVGKWIGAGDGTRWPFDPFQLCGSYFSVYQHRVALQKKGKR